MTSRRARCASSSDEQRARVRACSSPRRATRCSVGRRDERRPVRLHLRPLRLDPRERGEDLRLDRPAERRRAGALRLDRSRPSEPAISPWLRLKSGIVRLTPTRGADVELAGGVERQRRRRTVGRRDALGLEQAQAALLDRGLALGGEQLGVATRRRGPWRRVEVGGGGRVRRHSPATATAWAGGWFSTALRSACAAARAERASSRSACARARPRSAASTSSRGAAPSSKRACAASRIALDQLHASSSREREPLVGGEQAVERLPQRCGAASASRRPRSTSASASASFAARRSAPRLPPISTGTSKVRVLVRRVLRRPRTPPRGSPTGRRCGPAPRGSPAGGARPRGRGCATPRGRGRAGRPRGARGRGRGGTAVARRGSGAGGAAGRGRPGAQHDDRRDADRSLTTWTLREKGAGDTCRRYLRPPWAARFNAAHDRGRAAAYFASSYTTTLNEPGHHLRALRACRRRPWRRRELGRGDVQPVRLRVERHRPRALRRRERLHHAPACRPLRPWPPSACRRCSTRRRGPCPGRRRSRPRRRRSAALPSTLPVVLSTITISLLLQPTNSRWFARSMARPEASSPGAIGHVAHDLVGRRCRSRRARLVSSMLL